MRPTVEVQGLEGEGRRICLLIIPSAHPQPLRVHCLPALTVLKSAISFLLCCLLQCHEQTGIPCPPNSKSTTGRPFLFLVNPCWFLMVSIFFLKSSEAFPLPLHERDDSWTPKQKFPSNSPTSWLIMLSISIYSSRTPLHPALPALCSRRLTLRTTTMTNCEHLRKESYHRLLLREKLTSEGVASLS